MITLKKFFHISKGYSKKNQFFFWDNIQEGCIGLKEGCLVMLFKISTWKLNMLTV